MKHIHIFLFLILVGFLNPLYSQADSVGNGGSTYEILLQEAKLQTIGYLENLNQAAFSQLDIAPLSKEMLLDNYNDWVRKAKAMRFVIVSPSSGDQPLMAERDGKLVRMEALYDYSKRQLKIDQDLTDPYSHLKLATLLLHEVGHMIGFDFEYEENLNEIAAGIVQISNVNQPPVIVPPYPPIIIEPPCPPAFPIRSCTDPFINLRTVPIGFRCQTSKGGIFERVERADFGEAWKDLTTGLIWSDNIGRFDYDVSVMTCGGLGRIVPTRQHFERGEVNGFREVLPNITSDVAYWTSTLIDPTKSYSSAFTFNGSNGRIGISARSVNHPTLCVAWYKR